MLFFFNVLWVDGSNDDESCSDVARPLKCRILASELGRGAIASSGVTTRSKTWSFEKVGRNPSQVFYTETGKILPRLASNLQISKESKELPNGCWKVWKRVFLNVFCARFWRLHQGWCETLRHSGDLRSRTQRGPKQSSRKALIQCNAQESLQEKLFKKFFRQIVVFHGLHLKCLAKMWY